MRTKNLALQKVRVCSTIFPLFFYCMHVSHYFFVLFLLRCLQDYFAGTRRKRIVFSTFKRGKVFGGGGGDYLCDILILYAELA